MNELSHIWHDELNKPVTSCTTNERFLTLRMNKWVTSHITNEWGSRIWLYELHERAMSHVTTGYVGMRDVAYE